MAGKGESQSEGPRMGVIYMTIFLDFFASGVVLPLLQHQARDLGASGYNVGLVFTSYSTASILGSFVFGRMSDIIGRRPVILVSLVMSSVTLLLTALAPDPTSLIQARALAGFFSETSVAQAYIADKTTPEERPRYLGHMGAFIGLGFMVGPAVGAVLGAMGGFQLAAYVTTFVTALNTVYAFAKLDESLAAKQEKSEPGVSWGSFFSAVLAPHMMVVLVAQFLATFAFMGWDTTFGSWAQDRLGYTQKHTGWAFAWLAMAHILASWKMRALVKSTPVSLRNGGIFGGLCLAGGLLLHQYVASTLPLLLPLFIIGFGYGLSDIVFQTMVSLSTSKQLQGSMLGTLSSTTALARAASPVLTGILFDQGLYTPYNILGLLSGASGVLVALAFALSPPGLSNEEEFRKRQGELQPKPKAE